jgi:hypothetical protein
MTFEGITLPNCVFIWLLLALPAAACCSERDAVISFWIMLPAALIYGPAGGFRLAESSPLFCLPFRQLATGVLTVAWVVYPVATWLSRLRKRPVRGNRPACQLLRQLSLRKPRAPAVLGPESRDEPGLRLR